MKRIFIPTISLLFPGLLTAQGVYNNGGKIVLGTASFLTISGTNSNFTNATSGSAGTVDNNGTISLQGNWTNNASNNVFINNNTNGTVIFNGTSTQLINGSSNTVFENLTLNNSSAVTMLRDATVGNDFTHTAGGPLDLNGRLLTINGISNLPAIIGPTTITGSIASAIIFSGAINGNLFMTQSDSLTRSLSHLTLNSNGTTLNISNALNIIDSVVPTAGTIVSNGNLRCIADQSGTGKVGRVGTIGTNGSISGNVTIQTYVDPPSNTTDWRLLGVAGITGRTFSNWDDDTYITCSTCPDGYTIGGVNFTSILSYIEDPGPGYLNNDFAHYADLTTITSSIDPGKGYWVYLGSSSPQTASAGTLFDVTGPIQTAISLPLTKRPASSTEYGWNLIANPLPSPISWDALWNNNSSVDATMYIFSPNYGDLVSYNALTGISVPSSGNYAIGNVIPMGMGFYVHASANTSLSASENVKTSGLQYLLKTNPEPRSTFAYFSLEASGNNMVSEAAFLFDNNTTTGFDENYDALDVAPNYAGWLQISSSSDGLDYTVNALPALPVNLSIPIKITSGVTGSYKITPLHLENLPEETCLTLYDKYTGTNYNLRDGAFQVTLHDTETVARFTLKTFCADTVLGVASAEQDKVAIFNEGNTVTIQFNYSTPTEVHMSVMNALGQLVTNELKQTVENNRVAIELKNLSPQIVFVSVKNIDRNTTTNKKIFVH